MSDLDKLILMFNEVHGPITGSCYTEITYNEDGNPDGINIMKDGNLCWRVSKEDLLFDYITRNW